MANLPVAEKIAARLKEIAERMGKGSVRVGFFADMTYPDGTPVAAAAYWDEFGHGGQFPSPPRPFFRTMIAKESPGWVPTMAALAQLPGATSKTVLRQMGEEIEGQLKESIVNTNEPALSPTTLVLREKFGNHPEEITRADVIAAQRAAANGDAGASGTQAKPLVWTGRMLNSTGWEVSE